MKENTFKMIIMVFDICCLTLCTILNIQIAIQKEQLQAGKHVEEQIQQLEKEKRDNFVKLDNRNSRLTENVNIAIDSVQSFLDKYNDARQQTEDGKQAYEVLKSEYDKRLYLDTVILELDEENGSHEYVERFFETDKKSLLEILGQTRWEDEMGARFLEVEDWGELLPVGEQLSARSAHSESPDRFWVSGCKGRHESV